MTTPPADRITLNRDQLAALLAHHADTIAARWRSVAPWQRAAVLSLTGHAQELTADEETPAVRELLDSILSFNSEQQQPAAASSVPDEIAEQLEAIREMVDDTTLITPGSLIHGTYCFLLDEITRLQAAAPSAPADAERREQVAQALVRHDQGIGLSTPGATPGEHHYREADAVLAALPEAADRATIYRELAALQERTATTDVIRRRRSIATGRRLFAVELRRMADEQQAQHTPEPS